MNDNDDHRPFVWEGRKPVRRHGLIIVQGTRKDYSPGLITCQGKCSDSGDFWVWHDFVDGMYQCRTCAHQRHWGTPQYRRW